MISLMRRGDWNGSMGLINLTGEWKTPSLAADLHHRARHPPKKKQESSKKTEGEEKLNLKKKTQQLNNQQHFPFGLVSPPPVPSYSNQLRKTKGNSEPWKSPRPMSLAKP